MLILLDTKDLINLVEHSTPLSSVDFGSVLKKASATLAISFTNIREVVAPVLHHGDFLAVRKLLQRIEALPVTYVREAPIIPAEILAAVEGFRNGVEPQIINPLVRRWDYTFFWQEYPAAEMFVGYRLDEIVYTLLRQDPSLFQPYRRHGQGLRQQFAAERSMPPSVKKSVSANFEDSFGRHAQAWRLDTGNTDLSAVAQWVYDNPLRCPGLRLSYDMYHELSANLGDAPKDSDIPDFAHVNAIPYVNVATLDRRMLHYFQSVVKRLASCNSAIVYEKQVFRNIVDVLKALR